MSWHLISATFMAATTALSFGRGTPKVLGFALFVVFVVVDVLVRPGPLRMRSTEKIPAEFFATLNDYQFADGQTKVQFWSSRFLAATYSQVRSMVASRKVEFSLMFHL